ncbi:MAG: YCF48-related protein [Planctomycetaceae bacterium]
MVTLAALAATPSRAMPPESWRDDAGLHAVHFVDRTTGWAVGDHGAAYRTADGGKTWEPQSVSADVSLRSVFFLTADVGWAAGGTTIPFTGVETGAVFATEDGGVTWRQINTGPLPRIHAIRFFSRMDGVAAGASSPACASGVLTTNDGGTTWKPIQTATVVNLGGWRAASFTSQDRGVVVGPRGRRAGVDAGQLIASREPAQGLRGLSAVSLVDPLNGWAAGDGGLVLQTDNAGLVWKEPPTALPQSARDLFDLHAVAAIGEKVWVAGQPGSYVWHSPDAGRTWRPQSTGSPLPIRALHFSSETHGTAVGAMGQILTTSDGGITWQHARAADRRAALLAISLRPDRLSFPLVATLAGDQGYRAVALLPVRHDLGPAETETPNLDLRVHDAVTAAGGNVAVTDWPLPLKTPGIDREKDALVAAWNRRTEGKLERVLVGRLVAAIRMWRPEIIVLDEPSIDDAAAELLMQAARLAVAQAADSTRYVEHRPALSPWRVKKVYLRSRTIERPDATIDGDAVLSRLGLTTADLADPARARIDAYASSSGSRETYRLLPIDDGPPPAGPFFGGLALTPGSPARRAVSEPTENPHAALLAQRQRTMRAYATKAFDDPQKAAAVLAQIDELSAGLAPSQASRQLYRLAESYRREARWDLAEQMFLALIERYPGEPAARDAMTWLLRLWTGSEPVWRRMKGLGTTTTRSVGSIETLANRIDTAFGMAEAGASATTPSQIAAAGLGPDPLDVASSEGALKIDATRRWDDATVTHWRQQALRLGSLIRRTDPALFSSPQVQFPLAVAVRTGGGSAVAYMQRFASDGKGGGWHPAAAAELTLARTGGSSEVPTAVSRRAAQPPHLDGLFSDPCWQAAKAHELVAEPATSLPDGGLVLLSHDDKFLYLAASVPRVPGRPVPIVELAGRKHDADLALHDRLIVTLDLDRDYATYYRFEVDQRGQTADDCWGDASWNPQWFLAAEGDDARWRIEAAIPLGELGPRPPQIGELWAISIARVVPAVGVQGWPRANDGAVRPESFALLRFE